MLPRESPSHLRLVFLILEGYAYLLLIVALFIAQIVFIVWGLATRRPFVGLAALFIGIPLVVTTARAIRALFFRLPEPRGVPLPAQATELRQMVDDVRRRVQAPRLHRILIGDHFNASVAQLPRVGLFWIRNTLVIGYPLLATLPAEHLRAVVAHELGHLSRAHGRFSAWVYRTRTSWLRLINTLNERGATPAYVWWFFKWYMPRLDRYSLAIAREQEVLADQCAANAAGSAFSAETLVAIETAASQIEDKFWERVHACVDREPDPPAPFSTMGPRLWNDIPADDTLIGKLLEQQTTARDTHPSLGDRLSALGEQARLPARSSRTAGEMYLGSAMTAIAAALDARWQSDNGEEWRKQHQLVASRRDELRRLTALADPTAAELRKRARLIEWFEDADQALPHYREAHARGDAVAGVAVGRILLDRDDEAGVAVIEQAMRDDPSLTVAGCGWVIPYLERHNRTAEMHRFVHMEKRAATQKEMADKERAEVSIVDCFAPHTLAADQVSALTAHLARQPDVVQAFVVSRDLRYSSGAELVCAILASSADAQRLREACGREEILPSPAKVIVLGRHDQPLRAALEAVPGSLVYARSDP